LPENATDKSVEWSSSDETVAVVDENGVVTAIALGEAIITATTVDGSNLSASCKVTVVPTLAETITLDKTEISLEATETATLIVTVLPELTTDKSVEWTSSNEYVATIDANGLVTAIAVGDAIITVTTVDGSNLSATCKVTVVPTLATSITLDKTEYEIAEKSDFQLVATVLPELATDKGVVWSSSDKWVASVNENGLVTAYSVGEATITATTTDGSDLSASCKVTVVPTLAESITLDKIEISLEATETATLLVTVLPELTTDKSVEWSSSNESVATIDANGLVTAIAVGEAIITAATTDGSNLTASCKVTVVPTLAESITLDKTEISLEATETATLLVTVLPELATDKSVKWSSSDETVAVVDENGVVTAVAVGEAIITATTVDDSNLSATCKVTVIPTLVVSIELDQTEASVEEKSDLQLTATILPEHATNKEVAWSSSDKWVATVDNTGLVTIHSAGEVIITATTTDGTNLSATCRINVYSGIDGVNGDVIVATIGDNIVVKNAQLGSNVRVYAADGSIITSEVATDGDVVIEAPVKGIYIVAIDGKSFKVMVK
ncbi:MAG: Ig-like domain-containing protein, partial [Muribaculaceae bacterium]|nr:Ig-like domain-containing protein [Muribaculaceae bacterium]